MIGERSGGFAAKDGARSAAIEDEAGDEIGPINARFGDERQHLGGSPAIEGRRLHRDQHQVSGEQRRAHETGDTRRPIDDDVIGLPGQFRRFPV